MARGQGPQTKTALRSFDLTIKTAHTPTPDEYPLVRKALSEFELLKGHQVGMVCIAGSHGYGLAHENSDLDFRGFYVAPSKQFWTLEKPQEQLKADTPDLVLFELGKFCALALESNPNVLEILWADVVWDSPEGQALRKIRTAFLSDRVRKKYGGYAKGQFNAALNGQRDAMYVKRRHKALRHLFRLYEQGLEILETGNLTYRLSDPERIKRLSEMDDANIEREFKILDEKFMNAKSVLPEKPDEKLVEEVLLELRERNFR